MTDPATTLEGIFEEHLEVARATRDALLGDIADLAEELTATLEGGGKLLVFGNGGGAADAQHLAAELVGRFRRPRRGLAAVALTTDASVLTAVANDFDYEEVFARQVEALGNAGDLVLGISTSGAAANVVRGLASAGRLGCRTWALTGAEGGAVAAAATRSLRVPSDATARIQEMHVIVIHAVSELVDAHLAG